MPIVVSLIVLLFRLSHILITLFIFLEVSIVHIIGCRSICIRLLLEISEAKREFIAFVVFPALRLSTIRHAAKDNRQGFKKKKTYI